MAAAIINPAYGKKFMDLVNLEKRRLAALERLAIMETRVRKKRFDRPDPTWLSASTYTLFAYFSLSWNEKRQWFKSKRGLRMSANTRAAYAFCDSIQTRYRDRRPRTSTRLERLYVANLWWCEPHTVFNAGVISSPVRWEPERLHKWASVQL